MLGHNICISHLLKMRKDKREDTETRKGRPTRLGIERTMKKYEKR